VARLGFLDGAGHSVHPLSPVQSLWENLITSAFPASANGPGSFLYNLSLGLELAASDIMDRPPSDTVSNKEFAIDTIIYGIILCTMPLFSFFIVVYAVGYGNFGMNCGEALYPWYGIIYYAHAIVFVSLTILLLLHAFENEGLPQFVVRNRFDAEINLS